MLDTAPFEDFKAVWLEDIIAGAPSTVKLGQRFAHKIVTQWLDLDPDSVDVIYCDGAGDGGIDVAVLYKGDAATEEEGAEGDTWYLIQSKYGTAFAGNATLLTEGKKVIDTLDGQRQNLSSLAAGLLEKLRNFRAAASEQDRIRLVYATVDPLTEAQTSTLNDVRAMGRARLGPMFDVTAASVRTILDAQMEEAALADQRRLTVRLNGHLASAGSDLLVGSVSLTDLYAFLKAYRSKTGQLDQLFEKNVRKFLGGRVKVNRGMQTTLKEAPERFGLYNNGITITVSDFSVSGSGTYDLVEPFVVNGCQTTRTIWEVLNSRLDAGGSGESSELQKWRERAENGCVVAKIAKVGREGEELLRDITRFTNSQNAVREKDFISIDTGFKGWHRTLTEKHGLYLEIQRGGWESQKAIQKQNPAGEQFDRFANATDLIKVYGAGWVGEPGLAFGQNKPFLPGGAVFERMMARGEPEPTFGGRDLYAAFLLRESGKAMGFGRGGAQARKQTKFLFYFIFLSLLRDALERENRPARSADLTSAIIQLMDPKTDAGGILEEMAAGLIDGYFAESDENSVHKEPAYGDRFNADLNAFLKWNKLGRALEETPKLQLKLNFQKQFMGMPGPSGAPARKMIVAVLDGAG